MRIPSMQLLFSTLLLSAPCVRGEWNVEPPCADLGSFPANTPPVARFMIVNHSETPLEDVGVRTDCGCLSAKTDANYVPAGETLEVVVSIMQEGISGAFAHSIFVETHDGFQRVAVSGESVPLLRIRPSAVMNLGVVPPGGQLHAEFIVSAQRPVELGVVSEKNLEAKITTIGETEFLFVINGRAPDAPGPFRMETEVPIVSPDGWKPLIMALFGRVQ